MKRLVLLLSCVGLLALPAFAAGQAQAQRPNVANQGQQQQQNDGQQRPNAQQQQQNQIRQAISNLYSAKFREALDLTDDQFIKMSFAIQSFIDMRFNAAMRRERINQRLEELQSQPNESEVEELILERTRLNSRSGNMEPEFIDKIRPNLRPGQPGQIARILNFNKKFFDEDLPQLIDQIRAEAARRGQQGARANQNQNRAPNNDARPGNALRQNKQGQD